MVKTLNMFTALGYEIMTELGKHGNFHYPTEEFISTAVKISDTCQLSCAIEIHRDRIFSLRGDPNQTYIENHLGADIEMHYNLSPVVSFKDE
jgi:hypothetical protein